MNSVRLRKGENKMRSTGKYLMVRVAGSLIVGLVWMVLHYWLKTKR